MKTKREENDDKPVKKNLTKVTKAKNSKKDSPVKAMGEMIQRAMEQMEFTNDVLGFTLMRIRNYIAKNEGVDMQDKANKTMIKRALRQQYKDGTIVVVDAYDRTFGYGKRFYLADMMPSSDSEVEE